MAISDKELNDLNNLVKAGVKPNEDDEEEIIIAEKGEDEGTRFYCTDMGNGQRFANRYIDKAKWSFHWGWLIWDSMRWAKDEESLVLEYAKETALSIFDEAKKESEKMAPIIEKIKESEKGGIDLFSEKEELKEAKKELKEIEARVNMINSWAIKSQRANELKNMLFLAQSEKGIVCNQKQFDLELDKLNCLNGLLDLKTGLLTPHDPAMLVTKVNGAEYNPITQCPTWLAFLDRIMNFNQNLIAFIQRAFGYSLSGDVSEQCLFFPYGTGKNGKTTLCEILLALMGDYALKTQAETLLVKQHQNSIPNDVARLAGARVVIASELSDKRLNEGLVKDLTGGDKISARFLHKEFFDFNPQFKLWMYGNNKPEIRGTDDGIWRRIKLIPFKVTIPECERDKNLLDKLKAELPGILTWAIEGYREWKEKGLDIPKEVEEATKEYRDEMDVFGEFLSEFCSIEDKNAVTKKADFYSAYVKWAEENKLFVENQKKISKRMQERGFKENRDRTGSRYWIGIKLNF